MLHRFDDENAFDQRRQLAELDYVPARAPPRKPSPKTTSASRWNEVNDCWLRYVTYYRVRFACVRWLAMRLAGLLSGEASMSGIKSLLGAATVTILLMLADACVCTVQTVAFAHPACACVGRLL